jgi:hypothetical protein
LITYLIVVADAKDQLFSKESMKAALTEAVLGDEIIQFKNGEAHQTFARNGLWHGSAGARNRDVSAVLLLPQTGLWKLREDKWQPVLAINPWARFHLPEQLRALSRFDAVNDLWVFHDGTKFADILDMPDPWPPVETP